MGSSRPSGLAKTLSIFLGQNVTRGKLPDDPYLAVIQKFNQKGVHYVVVGMSAINFYARNTREAFGTMDYDFFVEPTLENVAKAMSVLKDLKFNFGTTDGPFQSNQFKEFVRNRRTLIATTPDGLMIELLLEISGYPFSELAKDAATFTSEGIPVRVGKLNKLIHSKRLAGRPKDRQFLQRYEGLLEEGETGRLE